MKLDSDMKVILVKNRIVGWTAATWLRFLYALESPEKEMSFFFAGLTSSIDLL